MIGSQGLTALHHAEDFDFRSLSYLLENDFKKEVNQKDFLGKTPLHHAAKKG